MFFLSAVKVLLSAGADVNVQDDFSSARRIARQFQTTPSQGKNSYYYLVE